MDKNSYKQMVAELIQEKSEIKQRLEQMTQDFHFDMRNKHMEETMLKNRINVLESRLLELQTENSEMKDRLIELGEDV